MQRLTYPWLVLLVALASLARPAPAKAQCIVPPGQNQSGPCTDQAPPEVTVLPSAGQVSQPGLPVLVTWQDQSAHTVLDRITLNGVDVKGAFEVTRDTSTTYLPDVQGPVAIETGRARGMVQLSAGQTNVLEVRVCDSGGRCSPLTYTQFTVGAPGVRVTPDGDPIVVPAGSTNTAWFRVHNTGSEPAAFALAAECRYPDGQRVTPCGVSASSVTVGARDSVNATVTFPTAQPSGGTVHVLLRAQRSGQPGIQDAGWLDFAVYGAMGTTAMAPIAVLVPLNAADVQERSQCITLSAALRGAYECGDLRVVHALPATHSRGRTRAPVLLYNSQHAHPRPTVYADVTVPANAARPNAVEMVVTLDNGVVHRASFRGDDFLPGIPQRMGVQWDALQTPTGLYGYTVTVISHYGGVSRATDGLRGEIAIVNRSTSYFGAGWWMAGLERIYCINCGSGGSRTLWVGGDGSTRVFEPVVPGGWSTWTARNPDGPPDTLRLSGGTYVRKLRGGGEIHYDGGGLHVRTVNRLGQTTQFAYNGNGLAAIYAPGAGAGGPGTGDPAWTMNWDNAALLVRSITATVQGAAPRTTWLAIDAAKRVTGITDPDTLGVEFGYDATATRRIVRQRDRRGTNTYYTYDAAGKLSGARLQMGAAANPAVDPHTRFQAEEARGVFSAGATGATSVATLIASTRIDGPRADVDDVTQLWLSRAGAVRRVRDALGGETFVQHDPRFPALPTQVTGPTGLVSRAHYDALGRVDTATVENPLGDGRNQATVYQYDNKWHLPTWVRAYSVSGGTWTPLAGAARAAYNTVNGNVLWRQQGDDVARRVSFDYYGGGAGAAATQLMRVRYPANAQNQLSSDSLGYDARGNLWLSRSALGFITLRERDALGRDTLVVTPIRTADTTVAAVKASGARQRIAYDVMDRVTSTEAIGPEITHPLNPVDNWAPSPSPAERLFVTTTYDNEGLPRHVRRWSTPDAAGIGELWTDHIYDAAGRLLSQSESSPGAGKRFEYDLAGNVTGSAPSVGPWVRMEYDAAGRVVKRTVPGVTYAGSGCVAGMVSACDWKFPLYPTGAAGALLIPEQVAYSRYDAAGNLVYAENADAIIRRSYFANGALRGDTLQLRNYETAGYDLGYGVQYAYDVAGRPVSLTHPQNLTGAANLDRFFYNQVTGALDSIVDRRGLRFGFEHDLLGQLVKQTASGGVEETFRYDRDGRRTWRQLVMGGSTAMQDTLTYDGRGKILRADNLSSVYTQWYAGLGALVATDWANLGDLARNREEFTVDPLGHVARRRTWRDQQEVTEPRDWITRYAPGSSAVQRQAAVWPQNVPGFKADSTEQDRDARGNLWRDREWGWGTRWTGTTGITRMAEARHFYDAEQRLRVLQRQDDTHDGANFSAAGVWEEYRYDPLGRRVMVRTRRGEGLCAATAATCVSSITRFVWAGDQLLWELKGPGTEDDNLEATTGSGERFGRVSYTHGGGIDRPLALHKEGSGSLIPHDNWRGQFASGTCIAVNGVGCGAVAWPGWQTSAYHAMTQAPTSENWRGGLVDGMRDASGQMYMRNRYYDPGTGQFTQPDPIGIAGGLNVYGFAAGDPVSYSDPYGLCAFGIGRDAGQCSETDAKHAPQLSEDEAVCPPCWGWVVRAAPAAARLLPAAAAVTVASSRILRANMAAAGIAPRVGHAAHHIVAGGLRAAAPARAVLARFQININDAVNGIYLPTSRVTQAASGGAYHRTLHTNTYLRAVNDALSQATTRQEAIDILRDIAIQLRNNAFPF